MELKWHSNIYTYVALVKAATQESTGCFIDEPKRKLLPRVTELEGKKGSKEVQTNIFLKHHY